MFRSVEIEPGSAEMNVLLYEATFPRLTISKLLPTLSAGFRKISADRCDPRVCVYIHTFVWKNFLWNLCVDMYVCRHMWTVEVDTYVFALKDKSTCDIIYLLKQKSQNQKKGGF